MRIRFQVSGDAPALLAGQNGYVAIAAGLARATQVSVRVVGEVDGADVRGGTAVDAEDANVRIDITLEEM